MSSLRLFIQYVFALSLLNASGLARDCTEPARSELSDVFGFEAIGDQGAVGDVVGVELLVRVDTLRPWLSACNIVGCFDNTKAELLDIVSYSEPFDELFFHSYFIHLGKSDAGPQRIPSGEGFLLNGNFRIDAVDSYIGNGVAVPLATLFFRLKGEAGDVFHIDFCDDEFVYPSGECITNFLYHIPPDNQPDPQVLALSSKHESAEVRILSGPTTKPDPPATPPNAIVYNDVPSPAIAAARFELTGGVAHPGEKGVPIELYITSELEFSGFEAGILIGSGISGDPSNQQFRIAEVKEWSRPGAVLIRQEMGSVGVAMLNSRRRVGAEGERVRIATIYLDISETMQPGSEIRPRFGGSSFGNSVVIETRNGPGVLPVQTKVEPLYIETGILRVLRSSIRVGDANADESIDLTDAVAVLNQLFLGKQSVLCSGAADCNSDGKVDMADPIALLMHLFGGGPLDVLREVDCYEDQ